MSTKTPKNEEQNNTWYWWEDLKSNLKLRVSDVFFSYFITFEIIYNWKFIVAILSSDAIKATAVIKLASQYIKAPDYIVSAYHFLGQPTAFTLSVLSALFMSVVYPVFASLILFLRKITLKRSNTLLGSGFPTAKEFNELKAEYDLSLRLIDEVKHDRVRDLGLLSQYLVEKEVALHPNRKSYQFAMSQQDIQFELDEFAQTNSSNTVLLEKVSIRNIQKDRLVQVLHKIDRDLYIVSRLGPEIQISKRMVDSGKKFFVLTKTGKPLYEDKLTPFITEQSLLTSDIKQIGELVPVTMHFL